MDGNFLIFFLDAALYVFLISLQKTLIPFIFLARSAHSESASLVAIFLAKHLAVIQE
jgi:hypothetical protein